LTLEERYLEDNRVGALVYNCPFGRAFDEPTVDMIEVLVSKLEMGTRGPLMASKQELATIGADAIPAMRALFDRSYQSAWKHGVVENILAACTLMDEPLGLDMLRYALGHPQESVRQSALRGLGLHGGPEDYDLVRGWLPMVQSPQLRAAYAACMGSLDPERLGADLAQWLEGGLQEDLYPHVIGAVLKVRDPETAQTLKVLAADRDDVWTSMLYGPAAALGDQGALDSIHRGLNSEEPILRQYAVQTLGSIGRGLDAALLFDDPHTGIRGVVAQVLVDSEPSEEIDAWLRDGIDDQDDRVREICLGALAGRKDELAVAHSLALLEGNPVERSLGIRCLRSPFSEDAALAEEGVARLLPLIERASAGGDVPVELLQTLAQIHSRTAALHLLELGTSTTGLIKGLDSFRWLVGQVWNTGPIGHELLREQLLVEEDPFRRLSLIEFVWQDHSDASRELLLDVLQQDHRHPFERLYIADRCTRLGPASRVASVIKRVYLELTHIDVRPALQCMLWIWYGQHFELDR
jgi:HEAT repeat protein